MRLTILDSSHYKYSANVTYSTDSMTNDSLSDFGTYIINNREISMDDDSWLRMGDRWYNSLYLSGTFTYKQIVNHIQIIQDNSFAYWDLNLQPKQ
mgnify:CR=1 FL=1